MKIAIITDHLRGGGKERRMVELMKGLSARNDRYKFVIIMMDGKSEEDVAYKYILDYKIPIYYLGEINRAKQVLKICFI